MSRTAALWLRRWMVFGWLALAGLGAHAHKASDAYAMLADVPGTAAVTLRLSLAVKDLDAALETLDADGNRQVSWGEIRQALPQVTAWVAAGVTARCNDRALPVTWTYESLEQRSDGAYVRVATRMECAGGGELALEYRLMKDLDPTHRLLVAGRAGGRDIVGVLAPNDRPAITLKGQAALPQSGPAVLAQFFPEGLHHIITGYDHLAFLLALLLPIALRRQDQTVAPDGRRRPGLMALVTTVTGFTLGHSITLGLATMGWIGSPSWVEPAIAITIGISAILNLRPVPHIRGDVLALVFGLIHGLGFSNIMREAGVQGPSLIWALAGFNLGVEAGQLAGVAVWCVVHLLLVRSPMYERVVVRGGSWALLMLAIFWTVQRVSG